MLDGRDVWNQWFQKDMGEMKIGKKRIYSFPNMKQNVYEMLKSTAQRLPNKKGICDNWNRSYTYREILSMVDHLAAYLKYGMHVQKAQHVGLLLHNGIEFAVSYYALSKIGAIAVPFPTKYREPELCSLIEKADLTGILISEGFSDWVSSYRKDGIFVISTQCEESRYGFSYLALDKLWRNIPQEVIEEASIGELDDAMILMFTSGTTSQSKGVVLKNYNINHAIMIYQRILELDERDKTIIPVPIYHITGLVALLSLFVYIGGRIYLLKKYDAERVLQGILKYDITFLHGSPTVFSLFLDYEKEYPRLPSIRKLACGSSYMPVETMKKLHHWMPEMMFHNVYGMTETSSPGTIFPYDAATSIYPGSEGKPVPGLLLKITDDEGNELENGQVGNVWLKGANICEYYYKIDSPLISEDGWLDTGDMGYVNEDYYVFIVDRKKDMINRGGEKIWCTDVEDEIIAIEGIKDAAVVGIPNEKYGEVAAAVVVMEEGVRMTEEEITNELVDRLAHFKIPEQILFVEKIPKTPGLKTDKRTIRKMFEKS